MSRTHSVILTTALGLLATVAIQAQKLSIEKTTVDCGRTGYRVPVTAEFVLKNKGLRHVTISDVRTDCGCTQVQLPKKSLGPGDKFTLRLTYDARMLGHFQKQAAVYVSNSKKPVYLKMQGVVVADWEDYSASYPYAMGQLMTDADHVEFDNVNKGDAPEVVINVVNNGGERMQPNVMHLPSWLTAVTIPETLEPGRKGRITLTLNSDAIHDMGLTQTSVYLASRPGDKVSSSNELPVSVVLLPDMSSFDGTARKLAPQLQLSSSSLDFGLVGGKQKKSDVISIVNTGQSVLSISSLQMFTSGLTLTLGKRELQPGEETKLKVTANLGVLRKARQRPRILMITNDPDKAKVIIDVHVK